MMYLSCRQHLAEAVERCFSRSLGKSVVVSRVTEHQKGRDCFDNHCNTAAGYEVDVA